MKRKGYLGLIFLILIITGGYFAWVLFGPTVNEPKRKYFYIHTGSSYQSVKDSLVANDVIKGTFWFDKIAGYLNYDKKVKPGRYKVTDGMSMVNLVRMLRAGNQSPVNLVINKLRTKEDLARKLSNAFEADSITVIDFLNNNDTLSKYDLDTNTVMTAVIPNTYTLNWNNTPTIVFRKLYNEQEKFWTKKRKAQAAALNLTEKQVYTLASIVEEETNASADKGKIASVYLNRMRTGMRLAADPTVKFAMKDFGLKRIYHKHLAFQSPYNTYLNAGLPPGPICTPSIKTIDAVLNAPTTNYLFFVAKADFSGLSNFATTYADHLKYAKEYQLALDTLMKAKQQQSQ